MDSDDLTKEDYQEAVELTPEQKKAWKKFEEAVKGLKKTNVYLYQVLGVINALNGNNVERVTDISEIEYPSIHPGCLHYLSYPGIHICDAWADDTHVVVLKKGRK